MSASDRHGPVVSLTGVDVHYGPVQALFDVGITVSRGETVVVLGGNASGKSTTLKAVLGLVEVSRGELRFDDRVVNDVPAHEWKKAVRSIRDPAGTFYRFTLPSAFLNRAVTDEPEEAQS